MRHRGTAVGWTVVLALCLGSGLSACGSRASDLAERSVRQVSAPKSGPVVLAPQAEAAPARRVATVEPAPVAPTTRAPAPVETASAAVITSAPLSAPAPVPAPAPTTRPPARGSGAGSPPAATDRAPTRVAAPADRYAFLVGVQHYRSPTHDTVASVADVVLIRQSLLSAGWLPQNIRVITDDQATGNGIRNGISWLAATSVPGKTFSFFHYSGHVKQFGGGTEALWPIDRSWVRDGELATRLAAVTGRVWVDIAGCEAASFLPGVASDRVLFTGSSKASQKSYEHPGWQTSVWTGLLFRTAPQRADADGDGRVVMGEALRYSQHYAQVVTLAQRPHGKQTPQIAGDPVRGWTLDAPPA